MPDWVFREDVDDGELGLAVRSVRQYERLSPSGKPEVVHGYQSRTWWIPHPDWEKGQQEWIHAGEAGWRRAGERNWQRGMEAAKAAEAREPKRTGEGGRAASKASQAKGDTERTAEKAEHGTAGHDDESDLPYWARMPGNGQPLHTEPRPEAEGTVGQGQLHERPVHGYAKPNPERLVRPPRKGGYARPEDHPAFQATPMNAENIKDAYRKTTPAERYQGRRWYPDMARLAWALGGGDAEHGARVLSAYSPQAGWPLNMFNAARALEKGAPLDKSDGGMFLPVHTGMAAKAFERKSTDEVFKGPKTNAFAYLGATGVDHPDDPLGAVVVDRHALNVAAGGNRSDEELKPASNAIGADPFYSYVADMFREAAADLSKETGEEISPSELQAITWLRQQRINEARDVAANKNKGLYSAMRNHWRRWEQHARDHGLASELGSTGLAPQPITPAEVAGFGEGEGVSQGVTAAEFFDIAARGRDMLANMADQASPHTGLTENFAALADNAWEQVQQSWGGVTIDAHSGEMLTGNEDKYAVSAKPGGVTTLSIPEHATEAQFRKALDKAVKEFGPLLQRAGHYLGIFHDDASGRIDFDPVVVMDSLHDSHAIGAYTRNVGGAYHFKSGNGYWPPHIAGQPENTPRFSRVEA